MTDEKDLNAFIDRNKDGWQEIPGYAESQFYDALAAAQAAFAPIHRSRTVQVAMKSGGSYSFAYAPLETILAATVPALAKNGLSLQQRIRVDSSFEEPIHYLQTILRKGRYEMLNEVMIFKTDATSQAYGGAVTYARRLGVTLLLCVAADDDNDGSEANLKAPPMQKKDIAHDSVTENAELQRKMGPLRQTVLVTDPGTDLTESERADLDAWIKDIREEMLEAAGEGRRAGIESIWEETRGVKHKEYVQTMLWRQLKAYPDQFKTINAVLRPPSDKGPRGPKAQDSVPQ